MKTRIYNSEQLSFFPVYALTASINFIQPYIERSKGYDVNQIFMVNRGNGILCIDSKTYVLEENDLFFVSEKIPHVYYPTDDNFSTTFISFLGEGFQKIKEYYNLGDYGVYKQKGSGNFYAATKKLYEALDAAHEVSHLCGLTFFAIVEFFDEAFKKQISPIEIVYNYLESNYNKMITLDDILTIYPYSKAKLCRDFKNKYSVSIFQMLTNIRLEHAKYMIKDSPHLRLKTVAALCGFNDISYFCKMYKKTYMCSPKAKK